MATLQDLQVKIGVDDSGVDKGAKQVESKFARLWQRVRATAAVAGAGIGVAAAAALTKALELDAAQAKLAARLGDPQLADQAGKIAGRVYARGFGESAEETIAAAEAVISSHLADVDDQGAIERLTVQVQAYAAAWGDDVADATQYASTLIGSGLAKDATHALDLITVASRKVPTALREDLLEAGDEYSQFFRALGFSGEQAFAALISASGKGKYGIDKMGDAIKEFTLLATDMSTSTVEAYEAIGLNAQKTSNDLLKGGDTAQAAFQRIVDGLLSIKDPTEQANTALAFFGTPLEDLNKADIPEFLRGMAEAGKGLDNVSGAAAKAAETLEQSASQKLESFKRRAQAALVEQLAKAIPYIERTFGWLSRNSGWVTPLAIALTALATAIGLIVAAMKVWAIVQTVLNLALWTSPITWIVAGILALVVVIALIATKTDWFQRLWGAAWGFIKGAVSAVWNWIKTNWPLLLAILTGPIGLAVLAIVKNWDKIKAGAAAVKDWIVEKFNALVNFFKGLPKRISSAVKGLWDGIKSSFRSAINWLISKWNGFSLTLGGGSILGMSIPSITLHTPDIPYLAEGGIVPATPGGRLAVLGEGRHDEAVIPLPDGARDFGRRGGEPVTVVIQADGTQASALLVEILRRAGRQRGAGNSLSAVLAPTR